MNFAPLLLLAQVAPLSSIQVDGAERQYALFAPTQASAHPPLVLCFHGHGGAARQAALQFGIHRHMPEAVVIYPQGLATATRIDPQGAKRGWQIRAGQDGDRDVKLTKALIDFAIQNYHCDPSRVFAMGHSNGGFFCYVLWSEMPEKFAAFGPISGFNLGNPVNAPKPAFIGAGTQDKIVPMTGAWAKTLEGVLKLDREPSNPTQPGSPLSIYGAPNGLPVETFIHDGSHRPPQDIFPAMVDFFRKVGG